MREPIISAFSRRFSSSLSSASSSAVYSATTPQPLAERSAIFMSFCLSAKRRVPFSSASWARWRDGESSTVARACWASRTLSSICALNRACSSWALRLTYSIDGLRRRFILRLPNIGPKICELAVEAPLGLLHSGQEGGELGLRERLGLARSGSHCAAARCRRREHLCGDSGLCRHRVKE